MATRAELGMAPIQRGVSHLVASEITGDEMRREVTFEPGHPRLRVNGRDYGIGALKIRFLLHGPAGSIAFLMSTGLIPDQEEVPGYFGHPITEWMHKAPSGSSLGIHADSEREHTDREDEECEYRPTGRCFYGAWSLEAEEVLGVFLTAGEEAMWKVLERRYAFVFQGKPLPDDDLKWAIRPEKEATDG